MSATAAANAALHVLHQIDDVLHDHATDLFRAAVDRLLHTDDPYDGRDQAYLFGNHAARRAIYDAPGLFHVLPLDDDPLADYLLAFRPTDPDAPRWTGGADPALRSIGGYVPPFNR